jgi:glycine oxidase
VKTWDVIIVGAGIIGLTLAREVRKRGARVLLVERGAPGREASHAAGGMLADCLLETPAALQALATASAKMYPEFVRELQVESGMNADLRDEGTIFFPSPEALREHPEFISANPLPAPLSLLEPELADPNLPVSFLKERCVDPRALTDAAIEAAKRQRVDLSTGHAVVTVDAREGRVEGVTTTQTSYHAPKVVNCAGAWSAQIELVDFPTRPVKGQMLCVAMPSRTLLRHVVRGPEVYLIPRSDGRIVIGTTLEEAGFDKRTDPDVILRLYHAAIALVPQLKNARILEDWAGLRPATPDALPILGETEIPGYYLSTGHFRDGILLAAVTARLMAQVLAGETPDHDLSAFSPSRFGASRAGR